MEKQSKSLTELIAETETRLRDNISRAETERNILFHFSQGWPANRLITRVHVNTVAADTLGSASVSADAGDRKGALEYLSAFQCEPMVYLKSGSISSMRAKAWLREKDIERSDTMIDCLPAYWSYDDYDHAELHAYVVVNGVRTHLQLKMKGDPAWRDITRYHDYREGSDILKWTLKNAPGGEAIKYSSGSPRQPGKVIVYFIAEPGGAAPDLAYYLELSRPVEWRSRY